MDSRLHSIFIMDLTALISHAPAFPSSPRAVALLMAELKQPKPQLRRLNQLFSIDPAMAARLLCLANSNEFASPRQVSSIPEALVLVDTAQLRELVSTALLGTTSGSVPGVNLQQFWRYSVHTAKLARSLAGHVHHNQGAAYTAGLLHGLGELVIQLANPTRSRLLNTLVPPLGLRRATLENQVFGFSYGRVAAALARRSQFPEVLVDALDNLAAPFEDDKYEPLAGIVHLAVWRTRTRQAGFSQSELAACFPDQVGLQLGLDIDMVLRQDPHDWLFASSEEKAEVSTVDVIV